jgi:transcriptional regulator with XRE-family HTH domain
MPSIDPDGKAWQLELADRVGKAVKMRRNALKLTAQQLAQRTVEIGYPVTRVTISKIESNVRAGKFDVAEWLVLARALEIPPALLLFPDYPDGPVQGLPGNERRSVEALWWVAGTHARTGEVGAGLVALVEQRAELTWELGHLDRELLTQVVASGDPKQVRDEAEKALNRQIRNKESQLETVDIHIQRTKDELWGVEEAECDE